MRREQGQAGSSSILLQMKIEPNEHLHMTAVVFDSLTLVKRLSSSGMPNDQAEAVVNMTRDVMLNVATKSDIDDAVRSLDPKFAAIDQRFVQVDQRFVQVDQRFASIEQRLASIDQRFALIDHRFEMIEQKFTILEQRLTIKLGSIVVIALGAFTAISKLIG